MGLAEHEWMDSVISIEEEDYTFEDFIECGKRWAKKLKEEGCEIVIALTHMRLPNDEKLSQGVEDIDLILGGHDHCDAVKPGDHNLLIKSGSDFREFSIIKVKVGCTEDTLNNKPKESFAKPDRKLLMTWEQVKVTSDYEPDPKMKTIIDDYWKELETQLNQVAGVTGEDLEARFDRIRTQETNI